MDADIELVLAAVDSSDEAVDAAEYAIAIAERYDADLHLLHILDQRVMRGVEAGDVSAETVADQQRAVTGRVRERLPETVALSHSGAVGFSPNRLGQTPGSVVLDAAEELEADFLVVPRVSASGTRDEVLGKAALHVLEYASQPVLSV
ncbi:universal stress protein UspA [Halobacteriales archaeon SW_7_65_23]|jgi:nucleotide-binding universal stress UspA family protein|nr:MAG: universal stress protein UspA [Halobacteriales archaeon SW_7_65_23]